MKPYNLTQYIVECTKDGTKWLEYMYTRKDTEAIKMAKKKLKEDNILEARVLEKVTKEIFRMSSDDSEGE